MMDRLSTRSISQSPLRVDPNLPSVQPFSLFFPILFIVVIENETGRERVVCVQYSPVA